ncbi:hypothetical protein ABZ737_33775, partial [Streptomyces sp. NPDC013087]|uniref:hypothetical protein n=1 Tax=Streptomyces sp. NPDC013087 TaxID=3156694 RepID=UPI0033C02B71
YIPSPVRDLFKEDLNALLGHGPYNDRSKNAKIKKLGIFTYLRSGKVVAKRHENHITRLKELV